MDGLWYPPRLIHVWCQELRTKKEYKKCVGKEVQKYTHFRFGSNLSQIALVTMVVSSDILTLERSTWRSWCDDSIMSRKIRVTYIIGIYYRSHSQHLAQPRPTTLGYGLVRIRRQLSRTNIQIEMANARCIRSKRLHIMASTMRLLWWALTHWRSKTVQKNIPCNCVPPRHCHPDLRCCRYGGESPVPFCQPTWRRSSEGSL